MLPIFVLANVRQVAWALTASVFALVEVALVLHPLLPAMLVEASHVLLSLFLNVRQVAHALLLDVVSAYLVLALQVAGPTPWRLALFRGKRFSWCLLTRRRKSIARQRPRLLLLCFQLATCPHELV